MTQHPNSTCFPSQHFSFICEGNGVFNLCRFVLHYAWLQKKLTNLDSWIYLKFPAQHENNNLNQYDCSIFLLTLERPTINDGVLDSEVEGELLGLIEEEDLLSAL
jgi:hypothetical protein